METRRAFKLSRHEECHWSSRRPPRIACALQRSTFEPPDLRASSGHPQHPQRTTFVLQKSTFAHPSSRFWSRCPPKTPKAHFVVLAGGNRVLRLGPVHCLGLASIRALKTWQARGFLLLLVRWMGYGWVRRSQTKGIFKSTRRSLEIALPPRHRVHRRRQPRNCRGFWTSGFELCMRKAKVSSPLDVEVRNMQSCRRSWWL